MDTDRIRRTASRISRAAPAGATTAAHPAAATTSTADETVLVQQIRYCVAIWSFAAGLLHVLAMIDHRGEPTLARGFLAVAVIQIVWGVLLIVDPRRMFVLVGACATAGSIVVWVYSRTKGISWFPGLDHVEELGWRDVVTQFFQLLALAGASGAPAPGQRAQARRQEDRASSRSRSSRC